MINKKINSVLLSSLLLSFTAFSAVPLYSDKTNEVHFSAQVQAVGIRDKSNKFDIDEDRQMSSNETWMNFSLQHNVNEAISSYAAFEWKVNALSSENIDDESQLFENRQAYLGIKGHTFGSLSFGKQWSATYQVLSVTDKLYVAKPDASGIYQGTDGGISGNGRIDDSILYKNWLGSFKFGIQYGHRLQVAEGLNRHKNWGAMLAYEFANCFEVGLGYSGSSFKKTEATALGNYYGLTDNDKISSTNISFSHKSERSYIGLNLVDGEKNFITAYNGDISLSADPQLADALGGDIYMHYQFTNAIQPYAYYSYLDFSKQDLALGQVSGIRQMFAGGLLFNISQQLTFGIEYRHHDLEQYNQATQGVTKTLAIQLQYLL